MEIQELAHAIRFLGDYYDDQTREPLSHEQFYTRVVNALGFYSVWDYVPFSLDEVSKAINSGDEHLNTLPILRWDRHAEFLRNRLLAYHGITYVSLSECVCTLKQCARMAVINFHR